MQTSSSKTINTIKIIILSLIIAVSASYVFAGVWTNPQCSPPGCNTDTPINEGTTTQTKHAGLVLDGGLVSGMTLNSNQNGLIVQSGRVGIGIATPDPNSKLEVRHASNEGGLYSNGGTVASQTWFPYSNGENYIRGTLNIDGPLRITAAGVPGAGKVLTSSDTQGNATWQAPSGGGVSKVTPGANIYVNPTIGTGQVEVGLDVPLTGLLYKKSRTGSGTVSCNAGDMVTGGGFTGTNGCVSSNCPVNSTPAIVESMPTDDMRGWTCNFMATTNQFGVEHTCYAVCANLSVLD